MCGAALAAVVILFAIPAIRHAGDATVHSRKEVAPAKLLPATPSVVDAPLVAATPSHERRAGLRVGTPVRETRSVRTVDSEDSRCVERDAGCGVFLHHRCLLTEQERLLLRIVHKNDPVEVAMLDPNQRNLEERKERAEYQSFFARPVIEQVADDGADGLRSRQFRRATPVRGSQLEEQQQEGQQRSPTGMTTRKATTRARTTLTATETIKERQE